MKIDDDGVIRFQQGNYVDMGGTTVMGQRPSGLEPTSYSGADFFGTNRDPYMGGATGFSPDLNSILFGTLDPTGTMLDQDAIAAAIAEYQKTIPEIVTTALKPGSADVSGIDQFIKDFYQSEGDLSQGDIKSRQDRLLTGVYEQFGDAGLTDFLNLGPRNVTPVGGPNDPNFTWDAYNALSNPALNALISGNQQDLTTGTAATIPAATAPVTTPPATTPSADDAGVLDLLRTGATKVGEVIDKALIGFGDLIGGFDPRLVVLNPVSQSGTVVFGNPSGNTTPTIIGNMPTSKAPIGVVTGNPTLDAILSKVFSKNPPGQSSPDMGEIIRQAVLDAVGEATGVNAGAVASAAQGDVGGLIDAATKVVVGVNKNVAETDEKYPTVDEIDRTAIGTDRVADLLEREPTNVDGGPTPVQPGGAAGPSGEETGTDDIIRLLGDSPIMGPERPIRVVNPDGSPLDPNAPISGPVRTVVPPGEDPPKVVVPPIVPPVVPPGEDPPKVVVPPIVSPDGPVTPPKTVTPTPIRQPQTAQGMYSVGTEKAGVADIGTPYDLNASLLDNIMRILAEKEAGAEGTELYGGGSVNGYNATDELIKLLRG